jgi:hypothetical protein
MLLIYVAHFSKNREISLSDITNVTRTIGSEQLRSVAQDAEGKTAKERIWNTDLTNRQ